MGGRPPGGPMGGRPPGGPIIGPSSPRRTPAGCCGLPPKGSTHLIADVEKVLDEVLFIDRGQILLQSSVDAIREEKGMSVDALFREVYKC